ncbi:MAG TPA: hypothetical protein VF756_29920 [Thermoanaerobaculia bacterium]
MRLMTSRSIALGFAFLALLSMVLPAEAGPRKHRARGWELLGARTVTDGADHDTIAVTASKGTFRSLQIHVEGRAVQFRDMKIHFANGDVQNVELRNVIPAGGESRVIDVEGRGDRAIRSVEFWYDAQSLGGKKATVKLYGKN